MSAEAAVRSRTVAFLERVGASGLHLFEEVGRFFYILHTTIYWAFRRPFDGKQWVRQMVRVGVDSIPVVSLTAMFTGMVMALQTYRGFERFHAEGYVASVVSLSLTRELAPVLAALMIAGRVGSSLAAELGTMRVTEQIDAMYAMATEPIQYLVVPRRRHHGDAASSGGAGQRPRHLRRLRDRRRLWAPIRNVLGKDLPGLDSTTFSGLIKAAVFGSSSP
jgi:ABC-type transporter Mla maintaining outer membrane lipid asymmetry permease subunit MlaE